MGVLNLTTDSFYAESRVADVEEAVVKARRMVAEGADVVDLGAESSRPGAAPVDEAEELARLVPLVERLRREVDVPLSIDTVKPEVADECLGRGAQILNDIRGFRDAEMVRVAARHRATVVTMHMQGTPPTMQHDPRYEDVVAEVKQYLADRVDALREAGVRDIMIDPGIGFGKTLAHNLALLRHLGEFQTLGCPILVGVSRKSFLGTLTGGLPVEERLEASLAAMAASVMNGARVVRVHDVKESKRAVAIVDAIRRAGA